MSISSMTISEGSPENVGSIEAPFICLWVSTIVIYKKQQRTNEGRAT